MNEPQYKATRRDSVDDAAAIAAAWPVGKLHTTDGVDPQRDVDNNAAEAAIAVLAYRMVADPGAVNEDETTIADLLSNLMHLADALVDEEGDPLDFDYLIDKARGYYEAEIRGEL